MSSGHDLRQRLFNEYATQLDALRDELEDAPEFKDAFLCPFCRNLFGRDALEHPPRVSIEHCIPAALGGTLATATLICTSCNNGMGSAIDSQLAGRFGVEEFFAGLSAEPNRGWITVGDAGRVRADLLLHKRDGKPSMSVYFDESRTPKGNFDEARRALDAEAANPQGLSFRFDLQFRYNQWKSHVALLRIGYLMMFRQYGYSYVLHPNLDRVRAQLLNPDEEIVPLPVSADVPAAAQHGNTVAILREPPDQRAFMVLVKLATSNRTVHKGVLMPGLDEAGATIYDRVRASASASGRFSGNFRLVAYNSANISNPKRKLAPYRDWMHVFPQGTE